MYFSKKNMKVSNLPSSDFDHYLKNYLEKVPDLSLLESLDYSKNKVIQFYKELPNDKEEYRYAENKWTPKEILLHLIDTERIFCGRALRFARNDKTVLPGYDHEDFVKESDANDRMLENLLEEYIAQRKSSLLLFKSFSQPILEKIGNANNLMVSVGAIGLVISGHELHHLQILNERYL